MKIRHARSSGFTLMEFIAVIVIAGILAVMVIPNLNLDTFQSQGFKQQAVAAIRLAQKLAVSTGCSVEVEISNADADVCELKWSGCAANANIPNPASGRDDFCHDSSPTGSVPTVNFTYDKIGAPSAGQTFSIDGVMITVEANTGFVHE